MERVLSLPQISACQFAYDVPGWSIHAVSDTPSYEQFLKVKRPDGTVDSLHMHSETPIAFSSTLLEEKARSEP